MNSNLKDDIKTVEGFSAEVWENVIGLLDLKTIAAKEFLKIALANVRLMDRKQQDYGSRNISGFGTFGVIVRMNDKFERLKSLFAKGRRRRTVNESIVDSFRDVANYAIIATMVECDLWPRE